MSWLTPRLYDFTLQGSERACLSDWRRSLLQPLSGAVLEIGAGTGLNLGHYPATVESLVLCEPDDDMRGRLRQRSEASPLARVELSRAEAEALPFDAGRFDAVVSTLVLCSVRDPQKALAEVLRVLQPGGRLAFLEHVAAWNNPGRLLWQRRVEPLWKRLAGNCHLTRDTEGALSKAGFDLEQVQRESIRKAMPLARPSIRGVALKS